MTKGHRAIYLDYHSTTPVDARVAERMLHYMTTAFGNASSTDHDYGDDAQQAVATAASQVAELIGASAREIVWTSGATESINLAIQGCLKSSPNFPCRVATLSTEHKAVLDTCEALVKQGVAEVIFLPVDCEGRFNLRDLEKVCADGISLLCVMAANNEIGTIHPLQDIGQVTQRYKVPWLCDASQAVGRIPLEFEKWGITYLAISAHKLYGPKGVGALAIRKNHHLHPILFGGGHQRGMRSGTLNVPGIVGLGEACRLRQLEMEEDESAIAVKRDLLQNLLLERVPGLVVNGNLDSRLAGNLHISVPEVLNSAVISRVRSKLAISTGSACSSGVEAPSHVLQALKLPPEVLEGALRIGIGKFTAEAEIYQAAEILGSAIQSTRLAMLS